MVRVIRFEGCTAVAPGGTNESYPPGLATGDSERHHQEVDPSDHASRPNRSVTPTTRPASAARAWSSSRASCSLFFILLGIIQFGLIRQLVRDDHERRARRGTSRFVYIYDATLSKAQNDLAPNNAT